MIIISFALRSIMHLPLSLYVLLMNIDNNVHIIVNNNLELINTEFGVKIKHLMKQMPIICQK